MKGYNARTKILNPKAYLGQELKEIRTGSGNKANFYRAVVVEVFDNFDAFPPERLTELQSQVSNPGVLANAPRNTIVARVVTNARDKKVKSSTVFYPFLPPHLSLPIKAGENVWVLFENENSSRAIGYWMWRTTEPDFVDDINYTHADRKFNSLGFKTAREKINNSSDYVPFFPNGGETPDSFTLSGGESEYDSIVNASVSYLDFTPEPVPRFYKRPGDTVLQGSNNTLIVLGEGRDQPAEDSTTSTFIKAVRNVNESGTIDIVAGRGRKPLTAPPVIQNSRQNFEVDKDISKSNGTANPREGDPDYVNDSSRLMVSMRTNGDRNLGLDLEGAYPEPFDQEGPEIVDDAAYGILKSDEIRIVARKDSERDIDGSIRILKEGDVNGDQASLLMLPQGIVRLDGEVIVLGRPGGPGPGPGGSEPYIKFSEYKKQMSELITIVKDIYEVFSRQSFPASVAAPGTPHPGLVAAVPELEAKILALVSLEEKLDNAQSTRIFGE